MVSELGLNPVGPSPRVRGAVCSSQATTSCGGTIPAGAGSRRSCRRARLTTGDHPRGCGEQAPAGRAPWCARGPSPRVRGAGRCGGYRAAQAGTIPAGAGSRSRLWRAAPVERDHPRGCGEQASSRWRWTPTPGPSPRVRGADRRDDRDAPRHGTIPAGAGSRADESLLWQMVRDHPRGCGEQATRPNAMLKTMGPSPRVRGAVRRRGLPRPTTGTIPAGAGSRLIRRDHLRRYRDHPRGCGEQNHLRALGTTLSGPSPRVRGAVRGGLEVFGVAGTIPAGAGSRLRDLRLYGSRGSFRTTFTDPDK